MSKLFLFLFLLIGVFKIQAQVNKSLISYFSFDNCDGTDVLGNTNVGQVNGNPVCVCGVSSQAFKFDGIDDNIFIVGNLLPVLGDLDFTLSFYFKAGSQTGNQALITKREDCTNINAFSINYNRSSNTIKVFISDNDTASINLNGSLDLTKCWQHVVVTRSARTHKLYLNTKLVDTQSSKNRLRFSNNEPLTIATGPCPSEVSFAGSIDEIRVYDQAIDPKVINELYLRPESITNFDTLIYLGGQVKVDITPSCASSFIWKPITGVSDPMQAKTILSPAITTTYKLEFNVDGCIASDTLLIKVVDPSAIPCDRVYLPKAFTPNGDNLNDEYGISNPFVVSMIKSFEIFDSWGGKMFTTSDAFERWDGTFNGSKVDPGVYLYRVEFDCQGKNTIQQGSVTVLK